MTWFIRYNINNKYFFEQKKSGYKTTFFKFTLNFLLNYFINFTFRN